MNDRKYNRVLILVPTAEEARGWGMVCGGGPDGDATGYMASEKHARNGVNEGGCHSFVTDGSRSKAPGSPGWEGDVPSVVPECVDEWACKTIAQVLPVIVSGVGMVRTAAAVADAVLRYSPDLMILAGIAGAYPGSGLKAGDCRVVVRETVADQGAFRDGGFMPLYRASYESALAQSIRSVPHADGYSVNTAGAAYMEYGGGTPGMENMEGAAFYAMCQVFGVPCIELRAVSNMTDDPREAWRMDLAVDSLGQTINDVLDEING